MTNMRIAVFDDHPIFRAGLAYTLQAEGGFELVASGTCAEDAIRAADELEPRIMLLDINIPGGGIAAARHIRSRNPAICLMFLTVSENRSDVIAALEVGVRGYLLKRISGADLIRTLHAVAGGGTYIEPGFAARLLTPQQSSEPDRLIKRLTARETEVLSQIARGQTNKEIGNDLNLSEKTIKHHVSSVLQKLGARNRLEAAIAGRQLISNAGDSSYQQL